MTVYNKIEEDDNSNTVNPIGESTLNNDSLDDDSDSIHGNNMVDFIRDTIRSTSTDLKSSPSANSVEFKRLIANAKLQHTTNNSNMASYDDNNFLVFSPEYTKTAIGFSENDDGDCEDGSRESVNYDQDTIRPTPKEDTSFNQYDIISDRSNLHSSKGAIENDESKWEDINDEDDNDAMQDHGKVAVQQVALFEYDSAHQQKPSISEHDSTKSEKEDHILANRKIKIPRNRIHKMKLSSLESSVIHQRSKSSSYDDIELDYTSANTTNSSSKIHANNIIHSKSETVQLPSDDRGRLYIKIIGLKNLTLPEIDNHECKFSILLDNGIHCISTPKVPLLQTSKIDQEFELTVSGNPGNNEASSLEFILTCKIDFESDYQYHNINNNYNKETVQNKFIEITESVPIKKKRWGGLLGTKIIYKTRKRIISSNEPVPDSNNTIEDPWNQLTAKDGSFARSYIDFAQYEPIITGKACNFDVTCFNEWEVVKDSHDSCISSKRKFYRIGKLEVQMLFIPRSKPNEIFPPSISVAFHSMEQYQLQSSVKYEGYMFQYGGDCSFLKKRYFVLLGTDLIAHNAESKKTRIKINLIKAVSIILKDDSNKASKNKIHDNYYFDDDIISPDNSENEYEFSIKFINGEFITFVAESGFEKLNWLRYLNSVISRNKYRQPWVKIMCDQN